MTSFNSLKWVALVICWPRFVKLIIFLPFVLYNYKLRLHLFWWGKPCWLQCSAYAPSLSFWCEEALGDQIITSCMPGMCLIHGSEQTKFSMIPESQIFICPHRSESPPNLTPNILIPSLESLVLYPGSIVSITSPVRPGRFNPYIPEINYVNTYQQLI